MKRTVVELFAGVGGFRVGLNEVTLVNGKKDEKPNFEFVWVNQWEPSTKAQHAFECYEYHFGKSDRHSNENISNVDKENDIPNHTLLVGGFPCQDYSVARSLSNEKGINGVKGVLWWQIYKILKVKRPPFILLENVDRLLRSPSDQRGRDFGVMIKSLDTLGYGVEWRVINAGEYGFPQRRRRVFIFGFHKNTDYYKNKSDLSIQDIIYKEGLFAKSFKVLNDLKKINQIDISKKTYKSLADVSEQFHFKFENSGVMLNSTINTVKTNPIHHELVPLRKIIHKGIVDEKYFIDSTREDKFRKTRKSKKIKRIKNGIVYTYSEGEMVFPDKLNRPGRTMLTSEGTLNRSTHVIKDFKTERLRILTPIEAERLNQFPDNWTNTGMPERKRYFMMGNALVCGVVTILGKEIGEIIDKE